MTSRWLTCFSLLLAVPALAGVFEGRIALTGGKSHHAKNLSGVVVWLEPVNGSMPESRPRRATMLQKDKMFTPHVLAIPTGSTIDFPNDDPIFHNAFSNFSGQIFDIGLYPPHSSRSVTFRREGVVRVFCNIHPAMSAVIVVLRSPYFAVTNAAGTYSIVDVPSGEYTLHVFHERATEDTLRALTRRVNVEGGQTAAPAITISEAGYLLTPHKNKYGKDYPPPTSEGFGYPGGK